VAKKKNPNGFASDPRNQASLYGLFGHQPYCPPSIALWRSGADHGDDPLLLAVCQHRDGFRTLFLVNSTLEAAPTIPMPLSESPGASRV
jgi:hypothetical protein